ncbi:uncharacterized protein [Amphiura filiformis]|uniref:uncharacterized protein n=1 Tax=Amphiura filiformis TaxID=82378 RepID=UPI003B21E73D
MFYLHGIIGIHSVAVNDIKMKYLLILLVFATYGGRGSGVQGNDDSLWTKFIFTFPYNVEADNPRVFITTEMKDPVMVSVSVPGIEFIHSTNVTKNQGVTIDLPPEAGITDSSSAIATNKTVIVSATDDVSVHGYYLAGGSPDGWFVLPTTALGIDYVAVGYDHLNNAFFSEFVVTAIEDNTTVYIKGQIELSMQLQQYESYQFVSDRVNLTDITGMSIKTDKPVSVMSGHQCANVPADVGGCDYLMEHLPPVSILGHQYILAPFLGRISGFVYRVVAASPGTTTVSLSGESISLSSGEFYEGETTTSDDVLTVIADKPIMVVQYAKGSYSDGVGDPFMVIIPPTQKYSNNATFPSGTLSLGNQQQQYISIIAIGCESLNLFNLDGMPLTTKTPAYYKHQMGSFALFVLQSVQVSIQSPIHQRYSYFMPYLLTVLIMVMRFKKPGWFVLPTTALGNNYVAAGYEPSHEPYIYFSEFVVTAIEDNTTVHIKGELDLSMTLQQYESYQFVSDRVNLTDITGMSIKADKPISVMSGHQCAYVPVYIFSCEYLMEHLPPVNILGNHYILAPFLGRKTGFIYRVVSTSPGTTSVSLSGESISLSAGEFYEGETMISNEVVTVMADKSIMVVQYAKGVMSDGIGDPFMMVLPSTQRFSNNVTFSSGVANDQQHYISIITLECDDINSFNLDGLPLSTQNISLLPGPDGAFCVLRTPVSTGFHSVTHPSALFLVLVYGFGYKESYGFVARYQVHTKDRVDVDASTNRPTLGIPTGPRDTKQCIGVLVSGALWQNATVNDCIGREDNNTLLIELSQSVVTHDNVTQIGYVLAQLTNRTISINARGLEAVALTLESIVDVQSPSPEVTTSVIETIENILKLEDAIFEAAVDQNVPTRILRSLEEQLTILQTQGTNITVRRTNIEVNAVQLSQDNIENGFGFANIVRSAGSVGYTKIFNNPEDIPIEETDTSIGLPSEVLSRFRSEVNATAMVPVTFILYRNSKLFQSRRLKTESTTDGVRSIGTHVISATIEGLGVYDLAPDQPVVSTYLHQEQENMYDNFQCVFWDFELDNGQGDWSNEGCTLVETMETDRSICQCDHLTSFAVLMDVYGQRYSTPILGVMSIVGCAISITALIIALITHLAVKSLRTKTPKKIVICLSFTLLCLYIVFVAGIDRTDSYIGCKLVAALLHYLTLSSVSWMGVEAVNLYLLLVKVYNSHVSHFMLKAYIAAWGAPLIPVIIVLAVDYTQYINVHHCFMQPGYAFYFADLLIIFLIIIFNALMFMRIIYKINCGRKKIRRSSSSSHGSTGSRVKSQYISRAITAVAITSILGLTWVFGFLTIIENRESSLTFQILFCIFNSLQGLLIFLLFCVRIEEIRDVWKRWIGLPRVAPRGVNPSGNVRGTKAAFKVDFGT